MTGQRRELPVGIVGLGRPPVERPDPIRRVLRQFDDTSGVKAGLQQLGFRIDIAKDRQERITIRDGFETRVDRPRPTRYPIPLS